MKTSDFRLGNHVNNGVVIEVHQNHLTLAGCFNISGMTSIEGDKLIPTPLTEAWLLKFGFYLENQWKGQKLYSIGAFSLVVEDNHFEFEHTSTYLKYVHELQNLYFATMKKELIEK